MEVLRTPDAAFARLGGFEFTPRYVFIPGHGSTALRVHYVDEGARDAPVVLMLHGEPTWSFLFRRVIGRVARAGFRAVAPDLVGFGRSDKPASQAHYTYQRHVEWLRAVTDALALDRIILLCHDWGGLLGLRLVADQPDRFAAVIATNTTLPTGDRAAPEEFLRWRTLVSTAPVFSPGAMLARACHHPIAPEVIAAYDAPFPEDRYTAGARRFPSLVPITPDDPASAPNRRAWDALATFTPPFLTIFGDADPYTAGFERVFQRRIPGAHGQPHVILPGVGHFLPEEAGDALAEAVVAFADTLE